MTPIERLQVELKRAREEYERADAICQNPYATSDHWKDRHVSWGRWNGIAKAIETLLENGQRTESIH